MMLWRGYNCVVVQWHSLSREEQAKYYEKARQERQLHMQLYPGWSARDNYGYGTKKKKRKKERTPVESGGTITRTLTHICRSDVPCKQGPSGDAKLLEEELKSSCFTISTLTLINLPRVKLTFF